MGLRLFMFAGMMLALSSCFSLPADASGQRERVLVHGAEIHGSNGVRIGPDGLLYVASAVGSRIDVFNPNSGRLIRSLGLAQGVYGPDDLAFSPDGLLYWTAFFTGQVMRMNAAGQPEVVAQVGPGVNAISFNAEGRLFVTRVFLADELYEIYPDGSQPPRLIRQGMGGLNAFDFGPDGGLYGPIWFGGQVARVDVESGELSIVTSGLDTPAAVKFSANDELHVIDQHQGLVLTVDLENGAQTIVATPGIGADNFDFDSHGRMYISNAHDGGIIRTSPAAGREGRRHAGDNGGNNAGDNGKGRELLPNGLSMPAGLAYDASGNLVVAATQSLRSYQPQTGREVHVQHASLGDPTTVATPLTVSAFGDDLLVSSWFSSTVQVWNPESLTLSATYVDFAVPLNAVAADNSIVVAELGTHRIVRRSVGTMDKEVLLEGIGVPTGMAYGHGDLYVADWLSGTIYKLMEDGLDLESPQVISGGLQQPEGMALDAQGRLLVVETGTQRLLRFDPQNPESPQPEIIAEDLAVGLSAVPGYPPSWLMSGVAVDGCGRITVSQDLDNSLLRIMPEPWLQWRCSQE